MYPLDYHIWIRIQIWIYIFIFQQIRIWDNSDFISIFQIFSHEQLNHVTISLHKCLEQLSLLSNQWTIIEGYEGNFPVATGNKGIDDSEAQQAPVMSDEFEMMHIPSLWMPRRTVSRTTWRGRWCASRSATGPLTWRISTLLLLI
jgi:hypothetical protein